MTKSADWQAAEDGGQTFAELYEASERDGTPERDGVRPGDTVRGTVVQVTAKTVFIDWGGKGEGWAEASEFLDQEGNQTLKAGDPVELKLLEFDRNGAHFGTRLSARGGAGLDQLRRAFSSGLPVEGQVQQAVKGGFSVDLLGTRAFCPISQIALDYCDDPAAFVGQTLTFRITEFEPDERQVVVSRRALLEEERAALAVETRVRLVEGAVFRGTVRRLVSYGAFVDIGGVDGFVHISEIAHEPVAEPSQVLAPGLGVEVKVLSLSTDERGRERISLSIKALAPDPWQRGLPFAEGAVLDGTVRNLESYGAFVEVAPGVQGLVHVSEISRARVAHPKDRLSPGQPVRVLVREIDHDRRRVSLSMRELEPPPEPVSPTWEETRSGGTIRRRMSLPKTEAGGQPGLPDGSPDPLPAAPVDEPPEPPAFKSPRIGLITTGVIRTLKPYGLFVDLPECGPRVSGLAHDSELLDQNKRAYTEGGSIEVEIVRIDERGRISLSQRSVELTREREEASRFVQNGTGRTKMGTMASLFGSIRLTPKK